MDLKTVIPSRQAIIGSPEAYVSFDRLSGVLIDVSWATLKRDISYMKDRLNAHMIYDRELGGYPFEDQGKRVGPPYELPGLRGRLQR